jgi:hypothetical protein
MVKLLPKKRNLAILLGLPVRHLIYQNKSKRIHQNLQKKFKKGGLAANPLLTNACASKVAIK